MSMLGGRTEVARMEPSEPCNKGTITGWSMMQDGRVQSEEEGVHDLVVRKCLSPI